MIRSYGYTNNSQDRGSCFFINARIFFYSMIFTVIFLSFAILGACREELEYDSFTGTWSYTSKDPIDQSIGISGEELTYDSSSGKWLFAGKDSALNINSSGNNTQPEPSEPELDSSSKEQDNSDLQMPFADLSEILAPENASLDQPSPSE